MVRVAKLVLATPTSWRPRTAGPALHRRSFRRCRRQWGASKAVSPRGPHSTRFWARRLEVRGRRKRGGASVGQSTAALGRQHPHSPHSGPTSWRTPRQLRPSLPRTRPIRGQTLGTDADEVVCAPKSIEAGPDMANVGPAPAEIIPSAAEVAHMRSIP